MSDGLNPFKRSGLRRRVRFPNWYHLAYSILIACLPTISTAQTDVVIERGLRHTNLDQAIAATAIDRSNRFLVNAGFRFVLSGRIPNIQTTTPIMVPVYLVESNEAEASTPAAVPRGCRCVFVNPAVLATWITKNSTGPGRMTLDRGIFLTFILLHEAGHIAKGTPAAVFRDGRLSQLNIAPSKAKANEEDADEFAAALLRRYVKKKPANNLSLDANLVTNELTKLSWNMQAYRTIDEFGAFSVGVPGVFFDNSYTHPNLAWRILRTNNLIEQSDATRQLLETFEAARERASNGTPLYNHGNP